MSTTHWLRRRLTATATTTSLILAPLALLGATQTAASAAEDDLVLNLIGVNDFHGRINAETTRWATTVESLKAASSTDRDLFIGAGDLFGASEFTSAVQNDQPTIDVFNALGLDASAVGNHEFDRGWNDLKNRVVNNRANARWAYLGANVYQKGTTTPVLPEYELFDAGALKVAVVGAVTEETPSLVSPAGIADLSFGDPVAAVNRVAGQLSDGNPANGEAQVIVASFHSGAAHGSGSSYAQEIAQPGEFAKLATLDARVDAVFNGHTHQVYAWDAPVPGQPSRTRPIVQTGEYGAHVGQVELRVDPATGDVRSYVARNHARAAQADLDDPEVKRVDDIVKAAQAKAAEIGNQPIGKLTADVTRAFAGVDKDGKPLEDRGAESALGELVANALRDGLPTETAKPDLGIVNPGGLRADLRYAGSPATNPADTDGVITYAEANDVLPFVNNVWTVELTGAQLKAVLEQQWQPAGSQRPYLHLGLSDNVEVTQDPSRPVGRRITSVRIDDAWLDPAKVYRVSTFSFLGTGGDNFSAFRAGKAQDTGLVDRDVWVSYLRDHPVSPDFARQQVLEQGLPALLPAGARVRVTLRDLDLTSAGAVKNTSVDVVRVRKGQRKVIKSIPVTEGRSRLRFTVPGADRVELVAQPSRTTVTRDVKRKRPKVKDVRAFPTVVKVGRTRPRVRMVLLPRHTGSKVFGTVKFRVGKTKKFARLGKVQGKPRTKAAVRLPRFTRPGVYKVTVKYLGNNKFKPAKKTYRLRVRRR